MHLIGGCQCSNKPPNVHTKLTRCDEDTSNAFLLVQTRETYAHAFEPISTCQEM